MTVQHWIAVFLSAGFLWVLWRLRRRMTRLNNSRETLAGLMGVQYPLATEPSARVRELSVTPGKRVEAIRALRAETGLGLREAVQIVDALKAQAGNTRA